MDFDNRVGGSNVSSFDVLEETQEAKVEHQEVIGAQMPALERALLGGGLGGGISSRVPQVGLEDFSSAAATDRQPQDLGHRVCQWDEPFLGLGRGVPHPCGFCDLKASRPAQIVVAS